MANHIIPVASLYERIALSGMSEDEVVLLKALLAKVYNNVISLGPRIPARRKSSAKTAVGHAIAAIETIPLA